MPFAFRTMRLQAKSLYSLINTWVEMNLAVTEEAAIITGFGFAQDIAWAFTNLVFDWEASISLPRGGVGLETGEYKLIRLGEALYACRDQQKYLLADQPVVVEVKSAP